MNLDGIRILDLTQLLPGPYGSQLLADMGAEVIKVEPPDGEPARMAQHWPGWAGYVFSAVNDGKKSMTLDLKSDRGQAVFYDLVADADVVFEQFRPGVVDRLGVSYEHLSEYNEELIYCSLSGYGQEGPYADRAGHDLNYVSLGGLADMTRDAPDDSPTPPGYPVADMTAGVMAATSILGSLLSRELGGGGEYIDLAMTDAVLSIGSVELAMADAGESPRPGETPIAGGLPWYGIYETSDGRHVALAALEPRFWEAFCETIDRSDLVEYHMTMDEADREWLRAELADIFAGKSRAEWDDLLGDVDDAVYSPVNTPTEALEDPHVQARDLLTPTGEGHRRVRFPARTDAAPVDGEPDPTSRSSSAGERPSGCPALGEHTAAILAEADVPAEELEGLREDGIV